MSWAFSRVRDIFRLWAPNDRVSCEERQRNIPPRNGFDPPDAPRVATDSGASPSLYGTGVPAGAHSSGRASLPGASIIRAASFPTPPRMRRTGSICPPAGRSRLLSPRREDFLLLLRDSSGAKLDSGAAIRRPIEAGSYTLLVNARVPGQVGQYSVQTSFTAEPGTLCSGFPSLGLSQTVGGIAGIVGLHAAGRHALRGVLAEHVRRGRAVRQRRRPPISRLRFSSARPMARRSLPAIRRVTATVDGDTRYTIVIATNDKTGAFQLTTAFQAADGETCRAVKKLSGADTVQRLDHGRQLHRDAPGQRRSRLLQLLRRGGSVRRRARHQRGERGFRRDGVSARRWRQRDRERHRAVRTAAPRKSACNSRRECTRSRCSARFPPAAPIDCAISSLRARRSLARCMAANPGEAQSAVLSASSCRTGLGLGGSLLDVAPGSRHTGAEPDVRRVADRHPGGSRPQGQPRADE